MEARRWLTWSMAAPNLDRAWNTDLCAVEFELMLLGREPWAMAEAQQELPVEEEERAQEFAYKAATIRVLSCTLNQNISRSAHAITLQPSMRHTAFLESLFELAAPTRFQLFYSDKYE